MSSIRQLLTEAGQELSRLPHADAALEARLLLSAALDKPDSYLFTWPERLPEPRQVDRFKHLLQRRLAGEPVAYILGKREFWSLELLVGPGVLIPRPETELLVELALDTLPAQTGLSIVDLGTGSGAIAAALASERPNWRICASELSADALEQARANFLRLGLERIETFQGAWLEAIPAKRLFDLIVSNPPYIADSDAHLQRGDLPHEPAMALQSGPSGMDDIQRICEQAPTRLKPGGRLMLEHGFDQGEQVRSQMESAGLERIVTHRDLAGLERATVGRRRQTQNT